MIFLDTNIAIAVRDGDRETRARVIALGAPVTLSTMTRVELESGVYRGGSAQIGIRRKMLMRLLETFVVEPFTEDDVRSYGSIVEALGYDRQRTIDRLIAAQALTRDATLITANAKDFRPIPGLKLEIWD